MSAALWFEVVQDQSLRQGDLFQDRLGLLLSGDSSPDGLRDISEHPGTWAILTASCDLERNRTTGILLAYVEPANMETLKTANENECKKRLEVIRTGRSPGLFLLPAWEGEGVSFPLSMVHFRRQVFHPHGVLTAWADRPRLRLRHPFREKFGNWVGARFGDVGPEDAGNIAKFATVQDHHVLLLGNDVETEG